ncbi:MAG: stage 0 sporulation family protein [Flavobacteriales bacterium]
MACAGCSTNGATPAGCGNKGHCSGGSCGKMGVFNWLANVRLPDHMQPFDGVEVRFKNGRKAIFKNNAKIHLYAGDIVVVEGNPGSDVGIVSLTGELVRVQIARKNVSYDSHETKKIYRKAKQEDVDKWKEARELEFKTMHRARTLALQHSLQMKISDVEYQGDKTKATFYYTAENRVDFRQLIKTMAEEFKVRIEMRQIGARQESGRLGGIGSCGRELCCTTWLTDFRTVSTSAARYQQLSLNPQKLAGQCGKLKCCLNYELDMYVEAFKSLPDSRTRLKTKAGTAFHMKTDIFKNVMFFAYETEGAPFPIAVPLDRVKEVIELNKNNVFPEDLLEAKHLPVVEKQPDYMNVVGQDSLTRFDNLDKKKKKKNKNKHRNKNRGNHGPRNDGNKNQHGPKN